MAIFHCYVSSPEGITLICHGIADSHCQQMAWLMAKKSQYCKVEYYHYFTFAMATTTTATATTATANDDINNNDDDEFVWQ